MTDRLVDEEAGGVDDGTGTVDAPDDDPVEDRVDHDDAEQGADAPPSAVPSAFERWRERRRRRVSKWDRPPPPKDWRYVVGTTGRVLITIGLLMFGFVAYQLWGTGIETARAQAQLEDEFEEQVDELTRGEDPVVGFENWTRPADRPATDDETADETDDAVDDDETDDAETDDVDTDDMDGVTDPVVPSPDDAPPSENVPGAVDLSDFAVDQDVPIVPGDSFALIEIPKIDVSQYIVPGVRLSDLKRGIGHYPDSPLPGQLGNASLAGHRTTYGAPFFDLDRLEPGDEIEITMVTGDRFVYRVTGAEIVAATDYWVVTTRDPNVAELTLTTCDPKYTARNRLVIHSVLMPEKSSQVGVAEFYQTADADEEDVPGDDPTLVTEPAAPADDQNDDRDPPATTVAATEPPRDTAPDDDTVPDDPSDDTSDDTAADEPAATEDDDDEATTTPYELDPAELDAFSQGWFDDRGAFGQIALWGGALTIIALLARRVSRATRHDSVGVLVGIVPFLFCLYFFYQNVNRLLPPGL